MKYYLTFLLTLSFLSLKAQIFFDSLENHNPVLMVQYVDWLHQDAFGDDESGYQNFVIQNSYNLDDTLEMEDGFGYYGSFVFTDTSILINRNYNSGAALDFCCAQEILGYGSTVTLPFDTLIELYNFNLQVGDTAYKSPYIFPNNSVNYSQTVEMIDTVILDSIAFKRFHLTPGSEIWIQGVGSNLGLFYPYLNHFEVGYGAEISVDYLIDSTTHSAIFGNNVFTSLSLDNEDVELDFVLFPNPSNGTFTLKTNAAQDNAMITLLSTSGKVVQKKEIEFKGGISTIKLDLIPGIYTLEIQTNNSFSQKRVVIN